MRTKIDPRSIQCCITSPPYWRLRDYKTEPLVWGGDVNCDHDWGDDLPPHHPGQVEQTKWKDADAAGAGGVKSCGNFCSKCGAWRGHLGLEPTPEMYVDHLVEIFRGVKDTLKDDGTLWLNLGDSYAGFWGKFRS